MIVYYDAILQAAHAATVAAAAVVVAPQEEEADEDGTIFGVSEGEQGAKPDGAGCPSPKELRQPREPDIRAIHLLGGSHAVQNQPPHTIFCSRVSYRLIRLGSDAERDHQTRS